MFWKTFKRTFDRYDEDDVADAVEAVIEHNTWFPSIAAIYEAVRAKTRRKTPSAPAQLPITGPREPVDMSLIREAMKRVKTGSWQPVITEQLREYAQRLFPDADDALIRRNYAILLHYSTRSRYLDENKSVAALVLDKYGYITERVAYRGPSAE